MARVSTPPSAYAVEFDVVIVGAGACGLTAALAARDANADVLVIERDAVPRGSTGLSSGFVPACGSRWQAEAAIQDDEGTMAADIQAKARGLANASLVNTLCIESAATLEWLADEYGLEWVLVEEVLYPGHRVHRMHAHPERTGAALNASLAAGAASAGVEVLTNACVDVLHARPDDSIAGLELTRPDGSRESVGCSALILACNGYGSNPARVGQFIPEMSDALYFGHPGNEGHALAWGEALGAATGDLGSYQGHGSVAHPHGILITWAVMMAGGIQVNQSGRRFSNEHGGYSEQAVNVLAQPGGVAWNIYDERIHELALDFPDYRDAEGAGAIVCATDVDELAHRTGIDVREISNTLEECGTFGRGQSRDPFGRVFVPNQALHPPYRGVRVTGALFHTQGGLEVDCNGAVLRPSGMPLPNLFAGGGAARGVSGPAVWGYLSGNGLLSAIVLGRLAGNAAARMSTRR